MSTGLEEKLKTVVHNLCAIDRELGLIAVYWSPSARHCVMHVTLDADTILVTDTTTPT